MILPDGGVPLLEEQILPPRRRHVQDWGVIGGRQGGGAPGGIGEPPIQSISHGGRVEGGSSLAVIFIHFTSGEGLRGGDGRPPHTPPVQSISRRARVPHREGSRQTHTPYSYTSCHTASSLGASNQLIQPQPSQGLVRRKPCVRLGLGARRRGSDGFAKCVVDRRLAGSRTGACCAARCRLLARADDLPQLGHLAWPKRSRRAASPAPVLLSMCVGSSCPTMRASTYTMMTANQPASLLTLTPQRLAAGMTDAG